MGRHHADTLTLPAALVLARGWTPRTWWAFTRVLAALRQRRSTRRGERGGSAGLVLSSTAAQAITGARTFRDARRRLIELSEAEPLAAFGCPIRLSFADTPKRVHVTVENFERFLAVGRIASKKADAISSDHTPHRRRKCLKKQGVEVRTLHRDPSSLSLSPPDPLLLSPSTPLNHPQRELVTSRRAAAACDRKPGGWLAGEPQEAEAEIAMRLEQLRVRLHPDGEWKSRSLARSLIAGRSDAELDAAAVAARAAYIDGVTRDPFAYFLGILRRGRGRAREAGARERG